MVLLVRDDSRRTVELQTGGAEQIDVLIAKEDLPLNGDAIRAWVVGAAGSDDAVDQEGALLAFQKMVCLNQLDERARPRAAGSPVGSKPGR